jgi:serine/threonine protein kinase
VSTPARDAIPIAERLSGALGPEFRILRPLGEGEAALVYLARETSLERLVAVKVLRPELARDDVVRRRFSREARAAARVLHPNVVVVHRVGEIDGELPYLIMECVEGRTLADALHADGPLEPEHARRMLEQVAGALSAAHLKGIVHRDIRPGNVIIEHDTGRAVLTDFGLSGIKESGSDADARLTLVGQALGDPRYTSPEQLMGEPAATESDIYSFGVLGYEALSGKSPFQGTTPVQVLSAKLQREPRPLTELNPSAPPAMASLLTRCLSRKPEHRPRAAELRDALANMPRGGTPATAAAPALEVSAPGDPPFFPGLHSFLAELRRRRVYRAAATYLAVAFVALQGADIVFPALSLPAWTLSALVGVTMAGFPIVLVLTWVYDLNRSGIERTAEPAAAALLPGERLTRRALQFAGILLSCLAVAALFLWIFR